MAKLSKPSSNKLSLKNVKCASANNSQKSQAHPKSSNADNPPKSKARPKSTSANDSKKLQTLPKPTAIDFSQQYPAFSKSIGATSLQQKQTPNKPTGISCSPQNRALAKSYSSALKQNSDLQKEMNSLKSEILKVRAENFSFTRQNLEYKEQNKKLAGELDITTKKLEEVKNESNMKENASMKWCEEQRIKLLNEHKSTCFCEKSLATLGSNESKAAAISAIEKKYQILHLLIEKKLFEVSDLLMASGIPLLSNPWTEEWQGSVSQRLNLIDENPQNGSGEVSVTLTPLSKLSRYLLSEKVRQQLGGSPFKQLKEKSQTPIESKKENTETNQIEVLPGPRTAFRKFGTFMAAENSEYDGSDNIKSLNDKPSELAEAIESEVSQDLEYFEDYNIEECEDELDAESDEGSEQTRNENTNETRGAEKIAFQKRFSSAQSSSRAPKSFFESISEEDEMIDIDNQFPDEWEIWVNKDKASTTHTLNAKPDNEDKENQIHLLAAVSDSTPLTAKKTGLFVKNPNSLLESVLKNNKKPLGVSNQESPKHSQSAFSPFHTPKPISKTLKYNSNNSFTKDLQLSPLVSPFTSPYVPTPSDRFPRNKSPPLARPANNNVLVYRDPTEKEDIDVDGNEDDSLSEENEKEEEEEERESTDSFPEPVVRKSTEADRMLLLKTRLQTALNKEQSKVQKDIVKPPSKPLTTAVQKSASSSPTVDNDVNSGSVTEKVVKKSLFEITEDSFDNSLFGMPTKETPENTDTKYNPVGKCELDEQMKNAQAIKKEASEKEIGKGRKQRRSKKNYKAKRPDVIVIDDDNSENDKMSVSAAKMKSEPAEKGKTGQKESKVQQEQQQQQEKEIKPQCRGSKKLKSISPSLKKKSAELTKSEQIVEQIGTRRSKRLLEREEKNNNLNATSAECNENNMVVDIDDSDSDSNSDDDGGGENVVGNKVENIIEGVVTNVAGNGVENDAGNNQYDSNYDADIEGENNNDNDVDMEDGSNNNNENDDGTVNLMVSRKRKAVDDKAEDLISPRRRKLFESIEDDNFFETIVRTNEGRQHVPRKKVVQPEQSKESCQPKKTQQAGQPKRVEWSEPIEQFRQLEKLKQFESPKQSEKANLAEQPRIFEGPKLTEPARNPSQPEPARRLGQSGGQYRPLVQPPRHTKTLCQSPPLKKYRRSAQLEQLEKLEQLKLAERLRRFGQSENYEPQSLLQSTGTSVRDQKSQYNQKTIGFGDYINNVRTTGLHNNSFSSSSSYSSSAARPPSSFLPKTFVLPASTSSFNAVNRPVSQKSFLTQTATTNASDFNLVPTDLRLHKRNSAAKK